MREAWRIVWANPYVKVFGFLVALYVLVRVFLAVQPAGTLFLVAFGLAYLLNPVVDAMQKRGVPRGFGVAAVAFVLVAVSWVVWQSSLHAISAALTEADDGVTLADTVVTWFEELPANLERLLPDAAFETIEGPVATAGDVVGQVGSMLSPYFEEIGQTLYGAATATAFGIFSFVLVVILTVYILVGYHRFTEVFLKVVPVPYQDGAKGPAATLDQVVGEYVRGQIVVAAGVGLMVFIGLSLIGVPLAGLIGLFAGALNIVPFLGSVLPAVPAVLLALAGGWLQIVLVVVVFVVANQIDNHVLTPMVLSKATKLHPIVVILAVLGGFAVGGLVGGIVSVPVVAFLHAMYLQYYTTSDFYRGEERGDVETPVDRDASTSSLRRTSEAPSADGASDGSDAGT